MGGGWRRRSGSPEAVGGTGMRMWAYPHVTDVKIRGTLKGETNHHKPRGVLGSIECSGRDTILLTEPFLTRLRRFLPGPDSQLPSAAERS